MIWDTRISLRNPIHQVPSSCMIYVHSLLSRIYEDSQPACFPLSCLLSFDGASSFPYWHWCGTPFPFPPLFWHIIPWNERVIIDLLAIVSIPPSILFVFFLIIIIINIVYIFCSVAPEFAPILIIFWTFFSFIFCFFFFFFFFLSLFPFLLLFPNAFRCRCFLFLLPVLCFFFILSYLIYIFDTFFLIIPIRTQWKQNWFVFFFCQTKNPAKIMQGFICCCAADTIK